MKAESVEDELIEGQSSVVVVVVGLMVDAVNGHHQWMMLDGQLDVQPHVSSVFEHRMTR